jgi:nucleoside 2-deoxyribosyltransferase
MPTKKFSGPSVLLKLSDAQWTTAFLRSQSFLVGEVGNVLANDVKLTPQGWQRVDDLKRAHVSSRYAFFARQFENADLDRLFDSYLRRAVLDTGYNLRTVTQKAGHIDAIIEDEIRRCRFLIADLSDDNAGAYWEAGFAQGLGKNVIYICRAKDEHGERKKTHFDTDHRQTIRWDVADPDAFAKQIKAVIRNTLLGDANQSD